MLRAKFVLLTLLCALPASSDYDRFRLFNACRPTPVVITISDQDIGLNRESLRAMVKSRLRLAGLYTEDPIKADFARLYVRVTLWGPAYTVEVQYEKVVTDKYGESYSTATWQGFAYGTSGDATYIFIESSLSGILDDFLAEYLRVNEAACESR